MNKIRTIRPEKRVNKEVKKEINFDLIFAILGVVAAFTIFLEFIGVLR